MLYYVYMNELANNLKKVVNCYEHVLIKMISTSQSIINVIIAVKQSIYSNKFSPIKEKNLEKNRIHQKSSQ